MFNGSYVAIVTPWTDDGSAIDFGALKDLIDYQIENGTSGILPVGTTGESATLTHDEHRELVRRTVELVDGRAKVMAGAGSNSTAESVGLAQFAKSAGADSALVITPYYNKPTPEGLLRHFAAVGEATELPIMMYNVPGRTGTNMKAPTVARIFKEVETVVCVKEASADVDQASDILGLCDIEIMSGNDSQTLPLMSIGVSGVVSVAANLLPREMADLVAAASAGDFAKARAIHYKILPLMRALFVETNPIPVKTALKLVGRLNGVLRLPLCELTEPSLNTLRGALTDYGLTLTD